MQRQMQEVIKVRAEYNGLFEKLTLSNKLYNEKDREFKVIISEQAAEISNLSSKNESLSKELRNLKKGEASRKKKFVQDAQHIEEIHKKLETKEYDMEMKFQKYKDDLATAARELHLKNSKVESLEKEIASLHFRLTNDSVPLSKHKEIVEASSSTVADLQRKISNDLISIVEYRNMVIVNEKLTKRMETDCVPLEEFKKLEGFLKVALSEKKLVEESVAVIEETKANAVEKSKMIQSKQALFDEKLERTERDLANEQREKEKLLTQMHVLQADLNRSQDSNNELKEQCNQLEKIKISCMIQIGNAKQNIRNEAESKRSAMEQHGKLREEFKALQTNNLQLQAYVDHLKKEVDQLKQERDENAGESLRVLQDKETLLKEFEQLFALLQEKCDTIADLEEQIKVFKEAVADEILHQFQEHSHPERNETEEEDAAEEQRRRTLGGVWEASRAEDKDGQSQVQNQRYKEKESPRTMQLQSQHRQSFRESQDAVVGSSQDWLNNHRAHSTASFAGLAIPPAQQYEAQHNQSRNQHQSLRHSQSQSLDENRADDGMLAPASSTTAAATFPPAANHRNVFNSSTNIESRAVTGTNASTSADASSNGNNNNGRLYASISSRYKLNQSRPLSPESLAMKEAGAGLASSLSSASWQQRSLYRPASIAKARTTPSPPFAAVPEVLTTSELEDPPSLHGGSMSPLRHAPPVLPETIYPSSFPEEILPSNLYPDVPLPFAHSGSTELLSSRNNSPSRGRPSASKSGTSVGSENVSTNTTSRSSSSYHNGITVGNEYRGVRLSSRYEETRDVDPRDDPDIDYTGGLYASFGGKVRVSSSAKSHTTANTNMNTGVSGDSTNAEASPQQPSKLSSSYKPRYAISSSSPPQKYQPSEESEDEQPIGSNITITATNTTSSNNLNAKQSSGNPNHNSGDASFSPNRADRMAQLVATKDKLKGLEGKIRMLSQQYEAETREAVAAGKRSSRDRDIDGDGER